MKERKCHCFARIDRGPHISIWFYKWNDKKTVGFEKYFYMNASIVHERLNKHGEIWTEHKKNIVRRGY